MSSTVAPSRRWTAKNRCPVCGGCERDPRGEQRRCIGYLSADEQYVHCGREELAGSIPLSPGSGTYAHRRDGPCRCGVQHGGLRLVTPPMSTHNGHTNGIGTLHTKVVAYYDYRAEDGTLLYQVLRYEDKSFSQRRPDGNGGWVKALGDTRRVLYHLPELVARPDELVVVAEGEKDVDNLLKVGLLATCNPGGAGHGKWRPEYSECLRGRDVVVIADVDDESTTPPFAGQKHGKAVVEALKRIARSAVYLELPQHDASDFLAAGGSKEELLRLAGEASKPKDTRPQLGTKTLQDLLKIQFPPPIWAVDGLLPAGLTLFAGKPKMGKSLFMLQTGLGIAAGGYVLGKIPVRRGTVYYLDMENGEELLQERVLAALNGRSCPPNFHYDTMAPNLDDGLIAGLDRFIDEHPDSRLIVLDTLEAVRGVSDGKQNIYREDYGALRPLADWAKTRRVCVVVLHHLNKSMNDDVFSTISGSYGLTGAVDNLMAIYGQEDDITLRAKGRRVKDQQLSIAFDGVTCQWVMTGEAEVVHQTKERADVLHVLKEVGGALYPREIAEELGRNKGSGIRMLLSRMVADGDLVRDGGKYALSAKELREKRVTPPQGVTGVTFSGPRQSNLSQKNVTLGLGGGVTGVTFSTGSNGSDLDTTGKNVTPSHLQNNQSDALYQSKRHSVTQNHSGGGGDSTDEWLTTGNDEEF